MVSKRHIYPGEAYRIQKPTSAEDVTSKRAEAYTRIRSLFDAGTPIFTKEMIRDVCWQLERSDQRGQKISVRGLDGVMVDFETESGRILPGTESGLEFILCVYRFSEPVQLVPN